MIINILIQYIAIYVILPRCNLYAKPLVIMEIVSASGVGTPGTGSLT